MVVESTVLAMGDGPVVFGNRRASRSHWPNETVPRFTSTEIVFLAGPVRRAFWSDRTGSTVEALNKFAHLSNGVYTEIILASRASATFLPKLITHHYILTRMKSERPPSLDHVNESTRTQ